MTLTSSGEISPQATYDAFAPFYDLFNERYQFRQWTGRLLAAAEECGLRAGSDRSLLDVGCGTGLSSIPMVDRGWSVVGCDISPRMIKMAEAKQVPRVSFRQADMRSLPRFGCFNLVWAVNDAMNYLLSSEELTAALVGMAQNAEAAGVVVFDVNTTATYSEFFDAHHVVASQNGPMVWRGRPKADPSQIHEAELITWDGNSHIHRQRHFTEAEVIDAFQLAKLDLLAVKGEIDGCLVDGLEDSVHTKAVYIGRAAS
jgi:SAM-dependent methyltransferase